MENLVSSREGGLPQVVRRLQIIVGSLVLGCVSFLAVGLIICWQRGAPPAGGNMPIITSCAVGFALFALAARAIVPGVIVAHGRRKILQDVSPPRRGRRRAPGMVERIEITSKLWAIWSAHTIVAAAILEGAAFFAMVAYLVECSLLSLIVTVGLILVLAAHIPTRSGLILWSGYPIDSTDHKM